MRWIGRIYPGRQSAVSFVRLSEPARIVKSARFAKAAAGTSQTAHVTCRAPGALAVTFSWSRAGDVIGDSASGERFTTERKQVRGQGAAGDGALTGENTRLTSIMYT